MDKPKKKRWRWVLLGLAVVIVLMAVMVFAALPRPLDIAPLSLQGLPLAEGSYTGECSNGLVAAKVEVTIHKGTVSDIRLLEHRNGMGQAAGVIPEQVLEAGALPVDAVAGATASSLTIQKAIENALEGQQGEAS